MQSRNLEDYAKIAEVEDKLDDKKRLAKDGSLRGVSPTTPGGKAEALLRSIDPKLREIVDKHTKWYEGFNGARSRKFTLRGIINIAEEWRNYGN